MTNELLEHWNFVEPDSYLSILNLNGHLSKDWLQIFYIARCLFSQHSEFLIKDQLAPLLNRREIFPQEPPKQGRNMNELLKLSNCSENLDLAKINSISEIEHILPREFILYPEDLFLKKLANRELLKKEFNDPEVLSVSDLVYGRSADLNRAQKVYILFDNSSSMAGEKLNKLYAAKAICLEYIRRVQKERPQIYFRSFNQELGPLQRIDKPERIKELIRYIIDLHTYDCYQTKIGDAILKAAEDIKKDQAFKQAEILMITDGLGDVPEDIEVQLGKIKFHMVLISGFDIGHFLDLYPNKQSLEKANLEIGQRDIPQDLDTYLKIKQVYRLQELAGIFVRIPSLFGEQFNIADKSELELIRRLRHDIARRLRQRLSAREKFEILQKIRYMIKYLHIMLSHAASPMDRKEIKREVEEFLAIEKEVMGDEWFAYNLENRQKEAEIGIRRKGEKGTRREKRSWYDLLCAIVRGMAMLPKHLYQWSRDIKKNTKTLFNKSYRFYKLKKKLRYINKKISKTLSE